MPPREWKLRIEDILEAIGWIKQYTAEMTFGEFTADRRTVDAVVRNFGIIGEAVRHLPNSVKERHVQIPWAKMRAMRNVVIHEYPEVDLQIIWDTIRQDLLPLVPVLREVLEREP